MKAHQLIALCDARGPQASEALNQAGAILGQEGKFSGHTRTYSPFKADDPAEQLPPERKLVQAHVASVITPVVEAFASLINTTAAQDAANQAAKADLVVGGKVLAAAVPVATLMFLNKKFTELKSLIVKIPVLDPAESWEKDGNTGSYKTAISQSYKTKKVYRNHEKSPATDRHPAQVEVYSEDAPIGTWSTTKLSGAIPATLRAELYTAVCEVLDGIKMARDKANEVEARIDDNFSKAALDYVFARLK